MCERKVKKDAPAAVVSRAACISRAPLADASRPALAGWDRPAWSVRVNLLSTILKSTRETECLCFKSEQQTQLVSIKIGGGVRNSIPSSALKTLVCMYARA